MQKPLRQLKPITIPQKKKSSNIAQLQKNLFDKIDCCQTESSSSHDILSMGDVGKQIDGHYDSLTQLLSKAQSITNMSQGKIMEAKKNKKKSILKGKQNNGTFLTGTGLYETQTKDKTFKYEQQIPEGPSPTEMLKDLLKKQEGDDLAQLRKMIKETDQNITACHKKIAKTHKNIMNYVQDNHQMSRTKKFQSSNLIKTRFR